MGLNPLILILIRNDSHRWKYLVIQENRSLYLFIVVLLSGYTRKSFIVFVYCCIVVWLYKLKIFHCKILTECNGLNELVYSGYKIRQTFLLIYKYFLTGWDIWRLNNGMLCDLTVLPGTMVWPALFNPERMK